MGTTLENLNILPVGDLALQLADHLKIVILRCPYANWKEKACQETFVKNVDLKLKGYLSRHAFGAMPVDGTDFVCDHLLICRKSDENENENENVPILGVKTLRHDLIGPFPIEFTIEAFLKRTKSWPHLEALMSILDETTRKGKKISYYSSWTMDPEVLKNRYLTQLLKEIFACITVHYHQEEGVEELLGLGVPKFKTEKFFYTWGFERVKKDGSELPCIPFSILHEIDGVFMHLKNYSSYALDLAEKYRSLWEGRTVIGEAPPLDFLADKGDFLKKAA